MPQVPDCFGSDPGPQAQAENCCHDCAYGEACQVVSAQKWPAIETQAGVDATIENREGKYGDFAECARLSDTFLGIANGNTPAGRFNTSWERMKPFQREALRNIFLKVSRILNGNPDYVDNWHDIGGYSKLVEDRLTK